MNHLPVSCAENSNWNNDKKIREECGGTDNQQHLHIGRFLSISFAEQEPSQIVKLLLKTIIPDNLREIKLFHPIYLFSYIGKWITASIKPRRQNIMALNAETENNISRKLPL